MGRSLGNSYDFGMESASQLPGIITTRLGASRYSGSFDYWKVAAVLKAEVCLGPSMDRAMPALLVLESCRDIMLLVLR